MVEHTNAGKYMVTYSFKIWEDLSQNQKHHLMFVFTPQYVYVVNLMILYQIDLELCIDIW